MDDLEKLLTDLRDLAHSLQASLIMLDQIRLRVPADWCGTNAGLESGARKLAEATKTVLTESQILDRDPELHPRRLAE